jgi:hypothetical protein
MKRGMVLLGWLALLGTVGANAQTKISGTVKCNKPEPAYKLEVGDRSGHAMYLEKTNCTAMQAFEVGGSKYKEGYSISISEETATRDVGNGTHVSVFESGDKAFVSFRSSLPQKDGKTVGDSVGTWSYTGGTGKLKGIKGKGTYKVTPNDDGTVTIAVEGEYDLPAARATKK